MKNIFFSLILIISIFCHSLQAETHLKLQTRLTTFPVHESINLTVVDLPTVFEIFDTLAAKKNIPFAFPERGCEARAHAMALLLEKENIKTGKIFATGFLKVNTPNTPSGFVVWRYHVAITMWVINPETQSVDTYVIDPSLFNKPVKIHDWVAVQMQAKDNRLDRLVQTPSYVYDLNFTDATSELSYNLADVKIMKENLAIYLKVQKERQKVQENSK